MNVYLIIISVLTMLTWHSWLSRPHSTWPLDLVLLEDNVEMLYKPTVELVLCELPYKAELTSWRKWVFNGWL